MHRQVTVARTRPCTIGMSWNQRHRLAQTAVDATLAEYHPHHSVLAMTVRGHVDSAAVERAWHGLQMRHPALLSAFDIEAQQWHYARIEPCDVTWVPPAGGKVDADINGARRTAIDRFTALARAPFDVERGPLARMLVVPVSPGENLLGFVIEHLVSDGWSRAVLLRDFTHSYNCEVGAASGDLPSVDVDIAEFTVAQNEYLESAPGRLLRQRIVARLADVGAIPDAPTAGFTGFQPVRHERLGRMTRQLDADIYDRLQPAVRRTRLTRLNLVHAAVHSAIEQLSELPRITTGLAVANRERPAVQNAAGWFASKVMVSSRARRLDSITEFLAAFRSDIVEAINTSRVPWTTTLFDISPEMFGCHAPTPFMTLNALPRRLNSRFAAPLLQDLETSIVPITVMHNDAGVATYWREEDGGLQVDITYKTDWYCETDVGRLWEAILAGLLQIGEAF